MASILFVTWDGGGNLAPALGIARELGRRGHAVRFLGHEAQRPAVESAGAPFAAYRRAVPWTSARQAPGIEGGRHLLAMLSDPGAGEDVLAAVEREPADLVVVDCMLFGALAAAQGAGLRRAVLVHTLWGFVHTAWSAGPHAGLARERGVEPIPLWLAADAILVTTLAALDRDGEPLPPNAHRTGVVWQGGRPVPATTAEAEQPLVLASLSTTDFAGQAGALQSILDAVGGLPVQAVVTTGPAVDPARLRAPANARVHRFHPHAELMPRASIVVGHGGHATTMLALAHDVPLLILPMHPLLDQPVIGGALAELGAAVVLPPDAAPDRIRAAAADLLRQPAYRAAAARLGAEIRERDGAVEAADRLEELLRPTPASPAPGRADGR